MQHKALSGQCTEGLWARLVIAQGARSIKTGCVPCGPVLCLLCDPLLLLEVICAIWKWGRRNRSFVGQSGPCGRHYNPFHRCEMQRAVVSKNEAGKKTEDRE